MEVLDAMDWPARIADEAELEEVMSRPDQALRADLAAVPGDLLVLGAAGKMGPTLCRLAKRADPALPDAPNVVFMAARKFGSTGNEALTWAMNVLLPAMVAERYSGSRIVFFSTGNVLPLSPLNGPSPDDSTTPAPVGEYAASCLGRERMFQHAGAARGTRCFGVRLNYAIDLRYGVLHDVASKVLAGTPVPLAMGHANVIWQGDANAWTLRALRHADAACPIMNVTGPETVSIRWLATRFGALMGREPSFAGTEAPEALLSNAAWAFALFGYPSVPLERLVQWVADWVQRGGRALGKPTKFEVRDGRF